MREGNLLLAVILVAALAVVFFGWLRREEARRSGRVRDWAGHGWRLVTRGPGEGERREASVPEWASGQDWQRPKIAVAGERAGYEVVVSWGETLSYSGLNAATAFALRLPGPLPDLHVQRRLLQDPEAADFDRCFLVRVTPPGSSHGLLAPPVKTAITSRGYPRGQILTVHGPRLMIQRNGWARPDDILPAVDDLVAIADALAAASVS